MANKILTKQVFEKFKIFENPNGRKNLRYVDNNYMLKVCLSDTKYWEKIMNKNLPGFNVPILCFEIEKEIEKLINSIFLSENYNSAVISPILKNYYTLSNVDLSCKNISDILILIRSILNYNAIAVANGFIHTDYFPSNIMLNNNLDVKIIDLDESIVDGYNMKRPYYAHNGKYLYNSKNLDSLKKVIDCDKVTLLNLLLRLLKNKKVCKKDALINPSLTLDTIIGLRLPEEYENKYIDILINKTPVKENDFFVDDFNDLLKNNYKLK